MSSELKCFVQPWMVHRTPGGDQGHCTLLIAAASINGACVLPLSGTEGLQAIDVSELRDGCHALGGEHAAALQLPVHVLLQEHYMPDVNYVGERSRAASLCVV
jgi:hypothetical protein